MIDYGALAAHEKQQKLAKASEKREEWDEEGRVGD